MELVDHIGVPEAQTAAGRAAGSSRAVLDPGACDALEERVGLVAAQLHALSAELVDLVAEFDSMGGADGFASTAQWLSVRGGFTRGEACRVVSLARRRDELPTLMGHARTGRLSLGVLATAARVADSRNEALVADIAVSCTPAQAARVLSRYRTVRPTDDHPPADPPDAQQPSTTDPTGTADPTSTAGGRVVPEPDTWWRMWFDEAGRGRIDAALAPDVAALVHQAWDAARTAGEADHRAGGSGDDPDSAAALRDQGDAIRRLCSDEIATRWATTMLDHAHDRGLSRPGGDRHGIIVDIDVATLARVLGLDHDPTLPIGLGTHAFDTHTGAHLADHDIARLLCDADLQVLVHHHGVPLWMSNTTRTANRHQRRALRFRAGGTGGCEHPRCTQTRYLDAHHVTYHRDGGPTALSNMVLLCTHHHRALHRGEFTISTTGDQTFTFRSRWGEHLGTTTTAEHPGGPPPHECHRPHIDQPPDPPPWIRPDTTHSHTHGERLTNYALDIYLTHLLTA